MIRIAVVGVGYWGPNLVRNIASIHNVDLVAICDRDTKRAQAVAGQHFPRARIVGDHRALVEDGAIDAVLIATPIKTHFELGSFFLESGRHVFIEKPLARTVDECQRLVDLADAKKRVLMVGHVFEHNTAVQRIKGYLDRGELGRLLYVSSQRVNLGRIQSDLNALWSFAPHDVSILNYWIGAEPRRASATGFSYLTPGIQDVAFAMLEYPGGVGAHLHLSWLDPRKVRQMTLVGSKKMLVFDDVSLDAKIQIFDKGVQHLDEFLATPSTFAEFQFKTRSGDVVIPSIEFNEPLQAEVRHFIDSIEHGKTPATDGRSGLRVVKVLEALDRSLEKSGQWVEV